LCGKVILPKLQKGHRFGSFFDYGKLFWGKRRRKVTGKKSKKVNPLDFIVVKVKNTYFGPKRSVREQERVVSPGVGRVLEPETNPLRFSGRFSLFVAMVLKKNKIKVCIWFSYTLTAALIFFRWRTSNNRP
jgi:hypothetical protein